MPIGDLWSRALGKVDAPLDSDLKRITDSDVLGDSDKDALQRVTQASHVADDRRDIMRHLHSCLSEPSGKRWRRVLGGLSLLDGLLQSGASALFTEAAEGHHFDLVQKLNWLESYEYADDKRVQSLVRQKACAMKVLLLRKLEQLESGTGSSQASGYQPDLHVASGAYAGKPKGHKVVNGVVAIGHQDDTSGESSDEESCPAQHNQRLKTHGAAAHPGGQCASEDSTDSDSGGARSANQSSARAGKKACDETNVEAAAVAAPVVNLLDF